MGFSFRLLTGVSPEDVLAGGIQPAEQTVLLAAGPGGEEEGWMALVFAGAGNRSVGTARTFSSSLRSSRNRVMLWRSRRRKSPPVLLIIVPADEKRMRRMLEVSHRPYSRPIARRTCQALSYRVVSAFCQRSRRSSDWSASAACRRSRIALSASRTAWTAGSE